MSWKDPRLRDKNLYFFLLVRLIDKIPFGLMLTDVNGDGCK